MDFWMIVHNIRENFPVCLKLRFITMETPINLMKMGINLSTNEFDYPLYVLMDGMNISNAKQFCSA